MCACCPGEGQLEDECGGESRGGGGEPDGPALLASNSAPDPVSVSGDPDGEETETARSGRRGEDEQPGGGEEAAVQPERGGRE